MRKAENNMTISQLAEKSRPMAENIIRPGKFIDDVRRNTTEIINGTDEEKQGIAESIVQRNPGVIPDHVEDVKEITALVLEIATLLQEDDLKKRQKSN